MVHKWLIKKGWGMILFGLILFFVVGPIVYIFVQPYYHTVQRFTFSRDWITMVNEYYRWSVSSAVGGIGIFFIIFGTMYFLATTILEYNKKRRLAHRSKM
jgi:hypothetical protein